MPDTALNASQYINSLNGLSFLTLLLQVCITVGLYQLTTTNCTYLFAGLCTVTSHGQLEIGHGGKIYTVEIGKYYKSGLDPPPPKFQ